MAALALAVWRRQNKSHRIPTFNSIFQVSERQRVKEVAADEKTKFDKEIKKRMRKAGLIFQPASH